MKRQVPRLAGPQKALARSELIGLDASIVESTDVGLVGRRGRVVDETLNTLTLREEGRPLKVAKASAVFEFRTPGSDPVRVHGRAIQFRPTDRTKKVR